MKDLLELLEKVEKDLWQVSAPKQTHAHIQGIFEQYKKLIQSGQYLKNQQSDSPSESEQSPKPSPRTHKK